MVQVTGKLAGYVMKTCKTHSPIPL